MFSRLCLGLKFVAELRVAFNVRLSMGRIYFFKGGVKMKEKVELLNREKELEVSNAKLAAEKQYDKERPN